MNRVRGLRHVRVIPIICAVSMMTASALLTGCGGDSPPQESAPADTPLSPSATGTATASTAPADTGRWTTIDVESQEILEPGTYAMPPIGPDDTPFAVVELPAGYFNWGPFVNANEPEEPDDPLAASLWAPTSAYEDACAADELVEGVQSVRRLASALVSQRHTAATKPEPVRLAGYDGLYLEVTSPTRLDYSRCDDSEVNYWEAGTDGARWTRMHGMVDRLWILDVDGRTMVVDVAVPPSATAAQVKQLTDIVQAARLVAA